MVGNNERWRQTRLEPYHYLHVHQRRHGVVVGVTVGLPYNLTSVKGKTDEDRHDDLLQTPGLEQQGESLEHEKKGRHMSNWWQSSDE